MSSSPTESPTAADSGGLRIERGVCYALFAYDVGFAIKLDEIEQRLKETMQRETIRHKPRAPRVLEFDPAPLRITQAADPITLGRHRSGPTVDTVLYDFGAVSVAYAIPIIGPLGDLLTLADSLYENVDLLRDSRRRVEALVAAAGPAVVKPHVPTFVEDYAIYQIEAWSNAAETSRDSGPQMTMPDVPRPVAGPSPLSAHNISVAHADTLARILRCESGALSRQEVEDALAQQLSYGPSDATIIDWNAAMLFGPQSDDVRVVLEFANVELLEMRVLDAHLDKGIEESYDAVTRRRIIGRRALDSPARELRRVAELQAENAILFEGINNAIKLIGDQFLARIYRLASQRFHLADWDAGILRKLSTLESIYQKMADQQSHWRSELLEWIIIVLILVEIALSLVPGLTRH